MHLSAMYIFYYIYVTLQIFSFHMCMHKCISMTKKSSLNATADENVVSPSARGAHHSSR